MYPVVHLQTPPLASNEECDGQSGGADVGAGVNVGLGAGVGVSAARQAHSVLTVPSLQYNLLVA
jgi:hypothetical protein